MMNQAFAWQWPEQIGERFCFIRLGMIALKPRALPFVWRFGRAIDRSARQAIDQKSGMFKSERMILSWNHYGYMQYWSDPDLMLAWTRSAPHTSWWKDALERQRKRHDFAIYHETYVASDKGFEAIYLGLDSHRPGASSFGELVPPKGRFATAKGRLTGVDAPLLTGQASTVNQSKV